MPKWISIVLLFVLTGSFVQCGGRVPSAKSAKALTKSYLKTYSKKYKDSFFGKTTLTQVEINRVSGQSLHHAETEAFVNFENGNVARVLFNLKKNPPLGWAIVSWEVLEVR